MPRHNDIETNIENKFCRNISNWAREHGILLSCVKLNLQGRRGFPDRLVLWEGGNLVFIEFKRPGEAPRKLQKYIHEFLNDMGFKVEVYDDADVAFNSIQAKIRATAPANEKYVIGRARTWIQTLLEAGEGKDGGSS